jgi:hypothetical protein
MVDKGWLISWASIVPTATTVALAERRANSVRCSRSSEADCPRSVITAPSSSPVIEKHQHEPLDEVEVVRLELGERRDGQIHRCCRARRLDNARRHQGQRRQISSVMRDLVLALRDLIEGLDSAFTKIAHPRARLCNRGQQRLDRLRARTKSYGGIGIICDSREAACSWEVADVDERKSRMLRSQPTALSKRLDR